jgi:hypothetical protein
VRVDGVHHERAPVERDDVLEVRRLRAQRGDGAAHEVRLVAHLQHRLVRPLEADRR